MIPVLEAVPNFSEGRDPGFLRAVTDTIAAAGAEVLDASADEDHHRSVVTYIGAPEVVEEASVQAALLAVERIDLRTHRGIHPRVGALDVLPLVPLHDLSMEAAVGAARRVGERLRDAGVPVWFYGAASDPPGRTLAELRRGGFESLAGGFPPDRVPDLSPPVAPVLPHPSAGVTCVGARRVLLAWNVFVEGVELDVVREVARRIRESGGGFPHLRALGLELPRTARMQVSMNLEDPDRTSPLEVFEAIEAAIGRAGGRILETEVIGMIPDALVLSPTRNRLMLLDVTESRRLSKRLSEHVAVRAQGATATPSPRAGDGG